MGIVLFDNKNRRLLNPLVKTKAVASLRMGIATAKERWEQVTGTKVFVHTENYLMPLYEPIEPGRHIWIDSSVLLTQELFRAVIELKKGEALADKEGLVAGNTDESWETFDVKHTLAWFKGSITAIKPIRIQLPHQIFLWNEWFIKSDFSFFTNNRDTQYISSTNTLINPSNIFTEAGVTMEHCTLNASTGPIYIGKNATLMEGCFIRGSFVLGNNSLLKMGTKIYGATTFGPNCVGGGEIKNVVMQGNSNKAHDGYLGDSVIGEWCNFGAGSSNSNVKNTGGKVHLWNEGLNDFVDAGQKCGVIMGDYSRVAINSSINTGSTIGVCCNVFGEGLLPKVIKDFSWGLKEKYISDKALSDINNWKKMKHQTLNVEEIQVLQQIFEKA
jgi:UDP-N-acetylglucosamine diphosphorylase/glucosamine-1-phosphate N-acetyltransferase